jgi:hypothetical protein
LEINVVDAPMGRGKTTALINYINESDDNVRYLYITPYLTEVQRIIDNCPDKKFRQPESYGTKINGIKHLFKKGNNIVSTHSLFTLFDDEVIELIQKRNYILIMDEVADVIQPLDISKKDLMTIREKYTEVVDGHILKWNDKEYKGRFEDYKRWCELGCIGVYNNSAILWLFPISTFRAFSKIYLLTYMFNVQLQKYYYDLYNVDYKYLYVLGNSIESFQLTEKKVVYDILDYKSLIHIIDKEKLNAIGESKTSLSKEWYKRNQDKVLTCVLRKNVSNFFWNYTKTKSRYNIWTTFSDFKSDIAGKGYTKGFMPLNMRATNEYRDRTAVAYLVNRFLSPHIKNYLLKNGIRVNEDGYALSEMIQWLFRSAIREGKEIHLYCPSKRMRELLVEWLDEVSGSGNGDEGN